MSIVLIPRWTEASKGCFVDPSLIQPVVVPQTGPVTHTSALAVGVTVSLLGLSGGHLPLEEQTYPIGLPVFLHSAFIQLKGSVGGVRP